MPTWHSSVFHLISWNWKHLINHKVQAKKLFWHMILHSYLCNALCKFFIEIESNYLKSKARDKSIQVRKKLSCHVIVNNYLCNVLCKFIIKIESTWRREIKEQAPQLTLLYCSSTARSGYRRHSIKKLFLKT